MLLQALSEQITDPMEQHPKISDSNLQSLTDFLPAHTSHLAQDEGHPLARGGLLEATLYLGTDFGILKIPIGVPWRANPATAVIKPLVDGFFDLLQHIISGRQHPPGGCTGRQLL